MMPRLSPTHWRTQMKIFEKFGCAYIRKKVGFGRQNKDNHRAHRVHGGKTFFLLFSEISVVNKTLKLPVASQ